MCRFASPEPGVVWLLEGAEDQPEQERDRLSRFAFQLGES